MAHLALRGVSKRYKLYPNQWAQAREWLSRGRRIYHQPHWALHEVSFEVGARESVGIIGMNGAGKSTLLRILAGTTQPTSGTVHIDGRVAALLELGLGMHPEFSGRENALLCCQLMGLDADLIATTCLPEIERFSELGEAMDQPLRTYSAGMHVRLAFSAATAVCPDVLIVDEALAVGDAYFQHKSMDRIRSYQERGMTLLFVTHDPAALKAICRRAILLEAGKVLEDGPVDAVFDYYNARIAQKSQAFAIAQRADDSGGVSTRSGSHEAAILSVTLTDNAGRPCRSFGVGDTAHLRYRIRINRTMPMPTAGFVIRDRFGSDVFGTNTHYLGVAAPACDAGNEIDISFEVTLNVGRGSYTLSAALHDGSDHLARSFDWWDRALVFDVIADSSHTFVGVAALPTRATVSR